MTLRIPRVRFDYRKPADPAYCSTDTVAAMNYLSEQFCKRHFVLIILSSSAGHSVIEKMIIRFVAETLCFETLLKNGVIAREADQDLVWQFPGENSHNAYGA
jgi:hypothetical protein